MKQFKWFFLSTFVFFVLLGGIFIAFDCDIYGVHEWHGTKSTAFDEAVVLIGTLSVLTMVFQLLKIMRTSQYKLIIAFFLFGLSVLSFEVVMPGISGHLCH